MISLPSPEIVKNKFLFPIIITSFQKRTFVLLLALYHIIISVTKQSGCSYWVNKLPLNHLLFPKNTKADRKSDLLCFASMRFDCMSVSRFLRLLVKICSQIRTIFREIFSFLRFYRGLDLLTFILRFSLHCIHHRLLS